MRQNKKITFMWVAFFVYFLCYMTMEIDLRVLLSLWAIVLSVYLLRKLKLPSAKGILLSVVFAFLVSIAYLGVQMGLEIVMINGIIAGVPTLLCSLAICSTIEKGYDIRLLSTDQKYAPLTSVLLAVAVGLILSVINYFLMKDSNVVDFEINLSRYMVCFSPAIFEEIACRGIFLAFGLYAVGEEEATKFQQFTIWFMMCFPHTVAHGYDIGGTILLCVLFGLPFAILQRKRDLTSAMISHGLVDAVRFTIFGLGL